MAGLTQKEEEFCRLVVCGRLSKADSYRKAFYRPDLGNAAASKAASRLSKKDEIRAFCRDLGQKATSESCKTLTERKEALSRMMDAAEGAGDIRAAVSCIAELNKMEQVYTSSSAVNVEVGVKVSTFSDLMRELEGK